CSTLYFPLLHSPPFRNREEDPMNRLCCLGGSAMVLAAVAAVGPASAEAPDPVQIGLVQTLFTDVPAAIAHAAMEPFSKLMRELPGLNGKAQPGGDAFDIARNLEEKKIHLGVFQGYEFAWVREKFPNLRPLMIAVYYDRHLHANVVVHRDSPAK